jgi:hypothetical protein
MYAGHHGRMRTAEIQLHRGQAAILDGVADIHPAVDILGPGAAD